MKNTDKNSQRNVVNLIPSLLLHEHFINSRLLLSFGALIPSISDIFEYFIINVDQF